MTSITYVITDELGIHARPAGKLVKLAKEFPCDIQVGTPTKMVDCKRIMGVMSLALKQGDEMTLTFDGENEEAAAEKILVFLKDEM